MIKQSQKKVRKRKAGMTSLEMVAVFLMFLTMFGFFFDTFTILNQHFVATKEANIVTRQIALQGGTGIYEPASFDRMGQNYQTSLAIKRRVNDRLSGVDIQNSSMYLSRGEEGWTELDSATTFNVPYEELFEFTLEYEYEWKVMGQLVPGMGGKRTRRIQRSAVSEAGV